MTAEELLNKLEAAEMVAPEVIASLRKQVAAAKEPIAVTAITKLLVDKGHLTVGQAQRLVGVPAGGSASTIRKAATPAAAKPSTAAPKPKPAAATTATSASDSCIHDDLGLAPLEDLGSAAGASTAAKSATTKSPSPAAAKPATQPAAPSPKPQITPVELDDLGLAPLEELEPLGPAPSVPKTDAAKPAGPKSAAKPTTHKAAAPSGTKQLPPQPSPPAIAGLDDLQPLDDLGGFAPLGDLPTLDDLTPLDADPLAAPAGPDPLADALGSTDLGALTAAALPAQPAAQQAAVAAAAANESRTTMLVGFGLGGAAILAVLIGLAAYLWPRGDGMREFQAAEEAYQQKQYAVAIEKYNDLLRRHPHHAESSLVRVHRGFARILAEQGPSPNFERLLPVVTATMEEIAAEPAIAQIHNELAPLLIQMTETLADQAASSSEPSPARLAAAQAALALCNDARLLPSERRPWKKLAEIDERLQLAAREQERSEAREKFQAEISQQLATLNGDFSAFLTRRHQFLATYPELAGDSLWKELGPAIAAAATKCIKVTTDRQAAGKDAAASPALTSVPWQIFNARWNEASPAAGEQVALVVAAGSVHALDLPTGQPRWSRYLGSSADQQSLVSADGRTAWLVDRRTPQLICVNAASGKLQWSQSLAEPPLGSPLLIDSKLYLSLPGGQVHCFDAHSGDLQQTVTLPQPLATGPVAADSKAILQLADEGLLYVLSIEDTNAPARCIWLGHDRGTATVSPAVFEQQILVPLQRGEQTELLVVSLDAIEPTLQRHRLDGNVAAPLTIAGQRLVASTAQGALYLLQLDPDSPESVKVAQSLPPPGGLPVLRYLNWSPAGLLAADRGVALFKFDASGKIQPAWSAFPGDLFDAPLQVHQQVAIGVRYVPDHDACYAAAIRLSDGQPLWQTAVAVPLALVAGQQESSPPIAVPAPAVAKLMANETAADLGAEFKQLLTQSSPSNLKSPPIVDVLTWGDERIIVPAAGARNLLLVHAQDFATRKLKTPGPLAGSPAVCGPNLLVPLQDGSIQSLSLATGEVTAAPFVVPNSSGTSSLSISVLAIGDEGKEVLVSDGHSSLYRISLVVEPKPHWAERAAVRLAQSMAAPPALVAGMVLAVDRAGEAHSFTLPELETGPVFDLKQARITWGPHRAGDNLLLATDRDELWCVGSDGQPRWSQPLSAGELTGPPLVSEGRLILTARSGRIEVRAAASGEPIATADLQEPLSGSSLLSGNTLWLATTGGQTIQTTIPTQEATP